MGEMRNAYNNFIGRLEGKTPLGKSKCNCVQWQALVNTVMGLRFS
jgi:hypothetical protein